MGKEWKLQGETPEKKLGHVEMVLKRLLRRPPQTATVMIPPIPFCSYNSEIPENGLLARWILPVDGVIKGIHVFAGMVADKVKPGLVLSVVGTTKSKSKLVPYRVGASFAELDFAVDAGSRLEITTSDPASVAEISLGILFEVPVGTAKTHQILLDAIP